MYYFTIYYLHTEHFEPLEAVLGSREKSITKLHNQAIKLGVGRKVFIRGISETLLRLDA